MRNHVKSFKNGLPSDAFAHQGFQVPMYDKSGKRIVGQENIKSEVDHRTQKWIDQYGSEPLSTHNINDVHIDMSGNMKTTVKGIVGDNIDTIMLGIEQDDVPQIKGQSSPQIIEITDENDVNVGVETRVSDKLLNNDQMAKASKSELTDLVGRILDELERRKNEQNTDNYEVSTQQLEDKLGHARKALSNYLNLVDNSPKPSNSILLPTIGIIGGVSLLVGGLIF
jgi:hypothetical protein